ncbi:MAG: type II toxin-antitoxin system VapC family toxin [Kiritimatiellia bacterium]
MVMNLCVDANAYSRFMRGDSQLKELLESADMIFIPATVLGELYAAFELGTKRVHNRNALDAFLRMAGVELVVAGKEIAYRYGLLIKELRDKGKSIPANDIWIAATALETGAQLVTYDVHFHFISGLRVLAP